jgi:hypothetical protein
MLALMLGIHWLERNIHKRFVVTLFNAAFFNRLSFDSAVSALLLRVMPY